MWKHTNIVILRSYWIRHKAISVYFLSISRNIRGAEHIILLFANTLHKGFFPFSYISGFVTKGVRWLWLWWNHYSILMVVFSSYLTVRPLKGLVFYFQKNFFLFLPFKYIFSSFRRENIYNFNIFNDVLHIKRQRKKLGQSRTNKSIDMENAIFQLRKLTNRHPKTHLFSLQ